MVAIHVSVIYLFVAVYPPTSDEQPSIVGICDLATLKRYGFVHRCTNRQALTLPSHPYPTLQPGGYFLLPFSALANCCLSKQWGALCCPDFPPLLKN